MKLSQIIEPFSAALVTVPARSLNVRAVMLRKAGLISSGGRGTGGAEMQASDCTNLLLAAMVGGEAIAVAAAVELARSASRVPHLDRGAVPPVDFVRRTLGETLDGLFTAIVDTGMPSNSKTGFPLTNVDFSLGQPTSFGVSAELSLDDGDTEGSLAFNRSAKAFDGVPEEDWGRVALSLIPEGRSTMGMRTRTTVDTSVLLAIGDLLRPGEADPE
jgi:hypothetical protein